MAQYNSDIAAAGNPKAIELVPHFRYVHEPIVQSSDPLPLLGSDARIKRLIQRLRYSRGGAFLVGGFRGVGKTTVVSQALHALESEGEIVVPVHLNIARPMTTTQLLIEIIRRLYETLKTRGLLAKIDQRAQERIALAYLRTSIAIKTSSADVDSREQGSSLAPRHQSIGGFSYNRRTNRSRSRGQEWSYLAYSEGDIEHDFGVMVQLLNRGMTPKKSVWESFLALLKIRTRENSERSMRLVVILDELDKLTATPEGEACFETLLTGIKNALVVSGVHFIVVAGADLYERFLNDSQRGNSVYESVFAWSVYLPCMWESANALLNHVVSDKGQNSRILADYLDYQARGIPRRLYQNLNQLVCWEDGGRAKIKLNDEDWERIEFYALLQNILFDFSSSGSEEPIFPNALDQDRWRLGTYHLVDWLLETRGRPFTLEDIDDSQKSGDIDVLLHLSRKQTEALLDHLLGHRLLEEIRSQTDTIRLMEDAPEAQARIFKVNMNIRHEISMEREGMGPAPQPECIPITFEVMPAPAAAAPPETYPSAEPGSSESQWRRSPSISEEPEYLDDGRYELRALVGHGGMGSVWEAWDRNLNTEVAVKISHRHANSDSNAVARFRREMGLVMQLRHPNIVRFYDTVHDGDRLGIVMDLVRGEKLSDLIESGVVSIELTMSIFLKLAEALVYLEDKGVYRLDLKPHNVILNENGEPILIDFGIAKWDMEEDFNTMEGVLIGTPHYMSPEQARGELLDIRSDLFSLGLVLVSMLHGGHPISGDSPMDIVRRLAFGQVALPELNVSSGLKGVIDKMTAADVDDRYRSANEMLEAFFESPEGLEFQAKRIKKRA